MKWYFVLGIGAAIFFSVSGCIWFVYHKGETAEKAVCQAARDADAVVALQQADALKKKDQDAADQIAKDVASQIDALTKSNNELEKSLTDEISKNDIYQRCVVPSAGVGLYNAAASGRGPAAAKN